MSTLNGQELEIFRAGQHGVAGKRVFSSAEVAQIARDYKPTSGHEAPIVIGHPKLDSPAWGWIKSLRADGASLFATPHQVVPEFDQAVQANQYKKRSAAFDPMPDGKWQLRHVGYLGGTPPVVKGLADATFASDQYEEFEFSTEGDVMPEDKKPLAESIRETFAEMFGGKTQTTQPADLSALEARLTAKFADDLKVEHDARVAAEAQFADFKTKHAVGATKATADAAIAKLKADGLWLKAFDYMGVPELFAAVGSSDTVEIEFADTKDTKKKLPTLDALSALIGSIAKFVPRGVQFGDAQAADAVKPGKDAPAGADPGSVQFDLEAKALAKAENVPYATAVKRLAAEGKSSESYAQAAAGAV